MAVNPRLLAAQQLFAQQQAAAQRGVSRGVQVSPVTNLNVQRARRVDADREAKAQAGKNRYQLAYEQQQQMQGGGEKGGGAGIGGVLGKILKPLEVLDYGRRGVMLGIESVAEGVPEPLEWLIPITKMVDEERTKADQRSLGERFSDPTYGAGQIFHQLDTGNELVDRWGNRAVGFAGDVALDPLTYLTLGSAKIPGATGRVALATSAQAKNLGREVVEAAGRGGAQAVRDLGDQAAVRALDIAEPGLRLGPRRGSVRIPGTGALEENLSRALNKVRGPLADTKTATALRKWGAARDPDTRIAVERLLTGQGALGSEEAASHILGMEALRTGKRTTGGMFVREATQIGDELGDDPSYVHRLETGDLSDPRVARLAGLQDEVLQWQTNTGKWDPAVNPNAPQNFVSVGQRPNRVPHVLTKEGREVFELDATTVGGGMKAMEPGEHQYSRVITPGVDAKGQPISYKIGGQDFTPVEGSIKEANDWAASVGLPKLYEDSPRKLAAVTVEQAENAVGEARRIRTLRGLRIQDPNDPTKTVPAISSATQGTATKEVIDTTAAGKKGAAALGAERAGKLEPALAAVQGQVTGLKTGLEQQGKQIVEAITRRNETALQLATNLDNEAKAALTAANKAARKIGDPTKAVAKVTAASDKLQQQAAENLSRAESALADVVERQGAAEGAAQARLATERARLEATVTDARNAVQERDALRAQLGEVPPPAAVTEVSAPKPRGRPKKVYVPGTNPNDVVRADMPGAYIPAKAKLTKWWNNKTAEFNDAVARAQQIAATAPDPNKSREFRDALGRAQAAKDDLDDMWTRRAEPAPTAVPPTAAVTPTPVAAAPTLPVAAMPDELDQRLATAQQQLQQLAATGDQRVAGEVAATQVGLQGERTAAEAAVADFRRQLDELPDQVKADIAQLHAVHRDVTTEVAGAKANSVKTAADVRAASKKLKASQKMRTEPRVGGRPDSYEALHADLTALAGQDVDPIIRQELNAYGRGVAEAAHHESNAASMGKFHADLKSGKLTPVIKRVLQDGYVPLSTDRIVGRDLATTRAMKAAMDSVITNIEKNPGGFGKALDAYTKFFKTWATATPGFHVRNALSATFMNLTEGTSFEEMRGGVRIWEAWRKNSMDPNWMKDLPPNLQDKAWDTVEAVYASGAGGQFSAAELGARAFGEGKRRGEWLTENRWTKRSQAYGERVEGGVRAGLALHALNGGESMQQAVTRIRRVHFDYSQVNELDQSVRRLIPFWTFMSRNLPLQVQQMWLKPRAYAQYNSLKRNFDIDPEGNLYMPEYMRDKGGFFLEPGVGVMPDIGSTQIQEQLEMVTNPRRLLSQVNPGFKVPLELMTNQDFYYGSQYKPNDFQKLGPETALFAPLLQAAGVAEQTPQGVVTERKYANAIYDLIPMLAQVNRGFSTTPNREGKGLQSALNYIGVPIRTVTPEDERKEIEYQRRASRRQDPEAMRQEALRQFMAQAG